MANQLKMATVQSILSLHEKGWTQQKIAQALGIDRGTVSRYLRKAAESAECNGIPPHPTAGKADSKPAIAPTGSEVLGDPPEASLAPIGSMVWEDPAEAPGAPTGSSVTTGGKPAGRRSDCEPWRDVILAKSRQGLSAKRIHQDLCRRACSGRLRQRAAFHAAFGQATAAAVSPDGVRAGEEAQVDFGTGAPVDLGRTASGVETHVFRIVLSHSRKALQRSTLSADDRGLHPLPGKRLLAFRRRAQDAGDRQSQGGGQAARLVRSGAEPEDPVVLPSTTARSILPTKPYTPRHKGKVERGVGYVQDNGLEGPQVRRAWPNRTVICSTGKRAWPTRGSTARRSKQVGKVFREVERAALAAAAGRSGSRSSTRPSGRSIATATSRWPRRTTRCRRSTWAATVWVRWDVAAGARLQPSLRADRPARPAASPAASARIGSTSAAGEDQRRGTRGRVLAAQGQR